MDGVTTVIVSVIFSALAALVTCVLLARFDVNGRMATAKNGGQQSKPSGRSGNAIYYTFPAKDTFVSSKKITARRSPCRAATA